MALFPLVGCRQGQGKENNHQVEQSRAGLSMAYTSSKYCALIFGAGRAFGIGTFCHYSMLMSFHH